MLTKEEIKRIHVESWNKLKEELDLGDPYYIEFSTRISFPTRIVNESEAYTPRRYDLRKARSLLSINLDSLKEGWIVAYHLGTYIPPRVMRAYTNEKYLKIAIVYENIHNCFGELNPTYHVVQNAWKNFAECKEVRDWGNIMALFEEIYILYLLYNKAEQFGIKKEDVTSHEISFIGRTQEDFEEHIKAANDMFEGSSLRAVMKDPWYFMQRYAYDYELLLRIEEGYELMKRRVKEVWKRKIDGKWIRLL